MILDDIIVIYSVEWSCVYCSNIKYKLLWHAEVLGALLSVLMIYGISGGLIYEATKRVKDPDSYHLDPDIMLIVSCGGIFINVL